MKKSRILIVEDERLIAEDIKNTLERIGYNTTVTSAFGVDAFKLVKKKRPDLVLMDIVLKGKMNGIEAAKQIHSQYEIPVVYLTAYADNKTIELAKKTEPFGYIIKPIEQRELHSIIEITLYKKQIEKRLERLNRVLKTIRNVNQLITRESNLDKLTQNACETLLETRDYMDISIAMLQKTKDKIIPMAHCGNHKRKKWEITPSGKGKAPKCVKSVSKTATREVITSTKKYCRGCKYCIFPHDHQVVIVPMVHDNAVVGITMVIFEPEILIDHEELDLLKEVMNDLAMAYSKIEAEEALIQSEKKYCSLIKNIPDVTWTIDYKGNTTFISSNVEKIYGYSLKEIYKIGNSLWFGRIHLDDVEKVKDAFKSLFEKGTPMHIEYRIKRKDGKWIWLLDRSTGTYEKNGIKYADGVFSDITARKRAEDALKESEERLKTAQKIGKMGDWELEVKSKKITWSDQVYQLFDRDPKQGPPNYDENIAYYYPEDSQRLQEHVRQAIESGVAIRSDYRVKSSFGKSVYYSSTINPIMNDMGKVIKLVGTVHDITDRKKAEEKLKKYREHLAELVVERTKQLQKINTELEEFAYSVSHDLRAPLRAIQSFSQILLEDYGNKFDARGKEYAKRIINSSQNMNTMIESLLSYSRLGREEVKLKPINLNKIIKEVSNQLKPKIKEKDAEVNVKSFLPKVKGHNTTLMKVISNLLINAVTFVDQDQKPKIKIWVEEHNKWVRLNIEDNGIGIAPEYQEKVFRIFERLHSVETYPGTGIGLAIVRKGVERMNGKVGLESTLGKGSKFWVELEKAGSN